ncbi:MAG: transposase [Dehalococcoidia bacterium]
MAIGRYSRHKLSEKRLILAAVDRAKNLGMRSGEALRLLGLSRDRYARWRRRVQNGELQDRKPPGRPRAAPPTPVEVKTVLACAREYPMLGARRLAWFMINSEIAGLRTWRVLEILRSNHLLRRSVKPAQGALRRPARPTGPNQQWHIDLMYVWVDSRWYYLVDVIDAYSRYIIHWKLALTLEAGETTAIAQEALETIDRALWPGLRVVRDNGSQFVSNEWARFIDGVGVVDIATRKRHPQSNGYVSHCTSFGPSRSTCISAARKARLRPCAFLGGFGLGSSYR